MGVWPCVGWGEIEGKRRVWRLEERKRCAVTLPVVVPRGWRGYRGVWSLSFSVVRSGVIRSSPLSCIPDPSVPIDSIEDPCLERPVRRAESVYSTCARSSSSPAYTVQSCSSVHPLTRPSSHLPYAMSVRIIKIRIEVRLLYLGSLDRNPWSYAY